MTGLRHVHAGVYADALLFEDGFHFGSNVVVLFRQECGGLFQHGYRAAEAPEQLSELQGDITGTTDWPQAGFPGIRINPESLLPEIVNEDAVREALAASTDPADHIFVLLVEGHASEAAELLAEARFKDPESFLLRIFEAEVLSVSHRMDRAVALFRQLLAEAHGTPGEALALE